MVSNSLQRIAKGTLILFIGVIISKFLSFIYRVLIARNGVEEYGIFSLALAVYGFAVVASSLGLHEAVLRYMGFYKGKNDENAMRETLKLSSKLVIVLSLIILVTFFFLSDWIAVKFFNNKDLGFILKIIILILPFDVLSIIFFNALRSLELTKYEVYIKNIIQNVLKITITFVFFIFGFKVLGMALGFAISIFISFLLVFYYLNKNFDIFKKTIKHVGLYKEVVYYSLPIFMGGFLIFFFTWTDSLMLGNLTNVSNVGLYNSAVPTSQLLYLFPATLMAMFLPILSSVYAKNNKDEFKTIYLAATRWTLICNFLIIIPLVVFSKEFLSIVFGSEYILASSALVVLLVGRFIDFLMLSGHNVLMSIKKTKIVFVNNLVTAFLNILLNILLIPKFGIIGAAMATSISVVVLALLSLFETYFFTNVFAFKKSHLKIIIVGVFSGIMLYLSKDYLGLESFLEVIISCIFFVIFYGILIYLTKSLETDDLSIILMVEKKLGFDLKVIKKFLRRLR